MPTRRQICSTYTQGVYTLLNPGKYTGKHPLCYRSRPEYMLMRWFDTNENIISWASESDVIWYHKSEDSGKPHRYFLDFTCVYRNKDGTTQKLFLEYKPKKFTVMPVKTKNMSAKTYNYLAKLWVTNNEKWSAAKQYAETHGGKFIVISEDSLGLETNR